MVLQIVGGVFLLLQTFIVFRVLLSWVPHDRSQKPYSIIYTVTDPVISPCREILYSIYRLFGFDERRLPFDFSPVFALVILSMLHRAVIRLLLAIVS